MYSYYYFIDEINEEIKNDNYTFMCSYYYFIDEINEKIKNDGFFIRILFISSNII